MTLKIISKTALPVWIEKLSASYQVIGPVTRPDGTVFAEIQVAEEMDLAYATTLLPPKKALLPLRETLFRFDGNGQEMELVMEERPSIIFGVHTCDLHAITLLDQFFGADPADQHYQARRQNTTIVSLECLQPCSEDAFCKDMGTLVVPDAFDVHLTDLGSDFALEVGSEKGGRLLEGMAAVREATAVDYHQFNQTMTEKWPRFPYRLKADVTELPSLLAISYRSQVWTAVGEQCLGCGACTLVCPTCTCFNVIDDVDFSLRHGSRVRVWDSCQFGQFASVAGGHDFRQGRAARQRHRFNRKYKYQMEAAGMMGCVGCGRCARACLVHIKPVDVLNKLHRQRTAVQHTAVSPRRQEVMR